MIRAAEIGTMSDNFDPIRSRFERISPHVRPSSSNEAGETGTFTFLLVER